MAEAGSFDGAGAGAGGDSSSKPASSVEKFGDRIRFHIELNPGETTIVSWKKLMKDSAKVGGPGSAPAAAASASGLPPSGVHPALESRLVPHQGQPAPKELNDAAPPSRFNAVIEKIERLYMGKDSSDDEGLDDIPDEDQYDTDDSFIDDAELDEYFEVDKLKTKHDGFFVNRGKLESIEPSLPPIQQPNRSRRKEMVKCTGESDSRVKPNKRLKVGREAAGKQAVLTQDNPLPSLLAPSGTHPQNMVADNKPELDAGASLKEDSKFTDSGHVEYYETIGSAHLKRQSGKAKNADETGVSFQQKEKNGNHEPIDLNVAAGKHSDQNVKLSHIHKREGSSFKPKVNMLDKAIRDLEKMVVELRPPIGDIRDVDATYQGTKRRLPQEIKQKLAKVARVAMSQGRVSKELLNRLMSILGHLINIRTLKRNLKIMISASMSANKEKDDRFQHIKTEVVEMIKARGPSLLSKVEQQTGGSDDFQEPHIEVNGVTKMKYSMDAALEDKICDLYDIFVDGLEDDTVVPQARKLYAELAELWPKGTMDNHGIKRAICHAKERRRILHDTTKDQERIKRNMLPVKTEETSQADSTFLAQPQHTEVVAATNIAPTPTSIALPFLFNAQNHDRAKPEKAKGASTASYVELRAADGTLVKKKVKRRGEGSSSETYGRPEKVPFQWNGEDRQKPHKQQTAGPVLGTAAAAAPQTPSFQFAATPSFGQLT